MKSWADVKFFQQKEFDSPDAPGTGRHMDLDFVLRLDVLRAKCGFPLVVHSGFRTPEHNAKVGGVDSSAHEMGFAADIRANATKTRFRILEVAFQLNFRRIGIGKTFIHLDNDPTKPQGVAWLY